MYIRTQTQFSL